IHNLTNLLKRTKRSDQAGKLFDDWLAAHRARPSPFLADALTVHAGFLLSTNDEKGELARLEEALSLYRKEPTTPRRIAYVNCLRGLGFNRIRAGRYAEAETLASEYHTAAARRYGPKSHA